MSKYYYHGCSSDTMKDIMQSGEIKTQRDLGYKKGEGYNGLDYISVCNKCSDEEYKMPHIYDAYTRYIINGKCFIISDEIEAIKTKYFDWRKLNLDYTGAQQYIKDYPENRWSDMIDEYQVKGAIPLKYIIGVGLPLTTFDEILKKYDGKNSADTLSLSSVEQICYSMYMNELKLLKNIIVLAKELNLDIINTNEPNFIDNYEKEKNTGEYNKEKVYSILRTL